MLGAVVPHGNRRAVPGASRPIPGSSGYRGCAGGGWTIGRLAGRAECLEGKSLILGVANCKAAKLLRDSDSGCVCHQGWMGLRDDREGPRDGGGMMKKCGGMVWDDGG